MCIAKCEIFFAVSFSSTSPLRKLRNGISVMEKPVFNLLNVGFCNLFSFFLRIFASYFELLTNNITQ